MNIFNKVTLQSMKKNRTRTLVTIIGVVLSAALITAVATFGTSLLNYMMRGSIEKYGNWHVAFEDIDYSFVQERANDNEVINTASFENIGYAMLDGAKCVDKPYLFISGFFDETFDMLPITLITGRLPENSDEVLVPSHIAIKAGVKISVGDTLILAVGNREAGNEILSQHDSYRTGEEELVPMAEKTYTVVGICERLGFEEQTAPGYTVITRAGATSKAASLTSFVTLANPRQVHAYASNTAGAGATIFNEDVLRFIGASDNKLFNALLLLVGGILVAIIMIGSIFLIYNSFNISLNERTRQFGILSSVGATAKQLRNSVRFEGLCIGVISIPLGVLLGIGGIALVLPIVASNFSTMINSTVPLTLSVSVPAIAVAAIVSLLTVLISAYIPARKAASRPVMESIRQIGEIKIEPKAVKISKLSQRIYGLEGTLALRNFKRNRKRYRSIVLSLTLSVVLFVSGNAFGTTLKLLSKQFVQEMDGDILFETQELKEIELFQLYDKIKTADGIYKSTYQANLTCPAMTSNLPSDFVNIYRASEGDGSTGQTLELPLYVQFIEDDIYYDFIGSLGLPAADYTGQDAKVLVIGMNTIEHTTYFTNQSMDFTLTSASGEPHKTISATFVDTYPLDSLTQDSVPPYLFMMVAPWQMKAQFELPEMSTRFGITLWSDNPTQSMSQIQSMIDEAGVTSDYRLINLSVAVDLFRSMTFVIDVFTYVFVIMISLIAVANVFNTISTNIKLRRRELAMLRSVGMSDHNFNKMMNFECVFYGMKTLLFGVPIAGVLSWLIFKGVTAAEKTDSLNYIFPWASMAISMAGVLFIVFITMMYATRKIKKENIIDALRDDMN